MSPGSYSAGGWALGSRRPIVRPDTMASGLWLDPQCARHVLSVYEADATGERDQRGADEGGEPCVCIRAECCGWGVLPPTLG